MTLSSGETIGTEDDVSPEALDLKKMTNHRYSTRRMGRWLQVIFGIAAAGVLMELSGWWLMLRVDKKEMKEV